MQRAPGACQRGTSPGEILLGSRAAEERKKNSAKNTRHGKGWGPQNLTVAPEAGRVHSYPPDLVLNTPLTA